MGWKVLKIRLSEEAPAELLSELSFELSSLGAWEEGREVSLFFVPSVDLPSRARWAVSFLEERGLGVLEVETSEEEARDWIREVREGFCPVEVGPFLVVPPWHDGTFEGGLLPIRIKPGCAFGTGLHGSTQAALKLLPRAFEAVRPRRALEVGVGSGILSIALLKLGCPEVVGVEIDRNAVEEAEENLRANGLDGRVALLCGDMLKPLEELRFDLLLANLEEGLLLELLEEVRGRGFGGSLLLSGLYGEGQLARAVGLLGEMGFEVRARDESDGWFGVFASPSSLLRQAGGG